MPLILHLSDVHLGRAELDDVADDYKDEFVPLDERIRRQGILNGTLEDLPRVLDAPLDAVIVSGDITIAGKEDGFEQFETLLGRLGEARPENDRVVVVPGNHDVEWGTPPSCKARYELFCRHVREVGYVTPLLEGIDVDKDGALVGDKSAPHVLAEPGEGWIVLPLNSANYSGSVEPLPDLPSGGWEALVEWLAAEYGGKALAEVQRLRIYDAARVSPGALEGTRRLLRAAESAASSSGGLPLKIGVLHHHLLPVSPREEVKSYESITNLGLVRNFLRDNRIGLVLHGHKHREYVYRDHVYPDGGLPAGRPHDVLVVSGATIGTHDWDQAAVGRLIRLTAVRTAPRASVAAIRGKSPGGALESPSYSTIPLWRLTEPPLAKGVPQVVEGETFDETYERVVSLFNAGGEMTNVLCSIRRPNTAEKLPTTYPGIPDVPDETRDEWFSDIVQWWQKTDSRLIERLEFTHGSRMVRGALDQIEDAADALAKDSTTTRAVLTLLDPVRDQVKLIEHKFPAFCLVQFLGREAGPLVFVDCIGYFRKQQMRYWWPVNVGELRHIQKLLLSHLGGGKSKFRPGALWTVTALAVEGNTVPRVAVPTLDRRFDEEEDELWSLAYAVAWEGVTDRKERVAQLIGLLDELIPEEEFDPDGVPVAREGLSYLSGELERLSHHHASSPADALGKLLGDLYRVNGDYVAATAEKVTKDAHEEWRGRVIPLVEQARGLLRPLTNGDDG